MSFETAIRLLFGVVFLFLLLRVVLALRSGRIGFAGTTYVRSERPYAYWRELLFETLTLGILFAALLAWPPPPQGRPLWNVVLIGFLFLNLLRSGLAGYNPKRERLGREPVIAGLLVLLFVAATIFYLIDWLGL